jgi:glutamyl-tRNA synthetase
MTDKKVRSRFAPSPTGYLHIGGLRTALYAYLFARKNGGDFLLRIEDTDRERLVDGAIENFINILKSTGIDYDAGPDKEDEFGPYIQSERVARHKEVALQLVKEGKAYKCFCTSERLDKVREEQKLLKQAPMYDRHCRYLSEKEVQEKIEAGQSYVIRQAIPLNERVKFQDTIRGKLNFDTNTLDDHVLFKSDGFPTYHLAAIVDDHDMGITHIIRGEEWLPSAPKHVLLFQALGWEVPEYAHLPLILNKDRTKLSKRQNDVSTESYLEKGYTKEALINFIAMLGWAPSDNQEIFSLEELEKHFELERVQKSGAIFDLEKLNWFNWQWKRRQHLENLQTIAKELDPDVEIKTLKKGELKFNFKNLLSQEQFTLKRGDLLTEFAKNHLTPELLKHKENDPLFFSKAIISIEEKVLKEPENTTENIHFYFKNDLDYNTNYFLHEKMGITKELAQKVLNQALEFITEEDFENEDTLKQKFVQLIEKLELKNGQVLWPTRVALTNQEFSPGVWELGIAYGYSKFTDRLQKAARALS